MLYSALFIAEILFLFFLSKRLQLAIFRGVFRVVKQRRPTIIIFSFLFLPGTFIHEVSHLLASLVLFVRFGKLELIPEELEGGGLKMGSLEVAKTDPIRRLLIGAAPMFTGTAIILAVIYFIYTNSLMTSFAPLLLAVYTVFEIGNTMFSSRKDMEGSLLFVVLMASITIAFYLLGVRISFTIPHFEEFIKMADAFLVVPIIIDVMALLLLTNI